jgi:hypothetical protein
MWPDYFGGMGERQGFESNKVIGGIVETATGIIYKTEVVPVDAEEIREVHKKDRWKFNWKKEFKKPGREVFKLVLKESNIVQGLISIEFKYDEWHIEMHLIEKAPHNKKPNKKFEGVAQNMVAFICKMSFEAGFDGIVAFKSKTNLIGHYKTSLGAESIFRDRMAIYTGNARKLIDLYCN